ncbi:rhodanese-like domain-containing protein [soil metagenome]
MSFGRRRNATRLGVASAAVLVATLLAGCADDAAGPAAPSSSGVEEAGAPSQLLEPAAFAAFMDSNPAAPVINVHIPYEGHIEGTDDFVSFEDIREWPGLPDDLDAPIMLYCRSGNMSAQATDDLVDLGYTNVVDLAGGMKAWTAAGLPLLDA